MSPVLLLVLASLAVGLVAGLLLAPHLDDWDYRLRRWWAEPGFRRRNAVARYWSQPPPPDRSTNQCRSIVLGRGRCLHDVNHLGDHLYPADLSLPTGDPGHPS